MDKNIYRYELGKIYKSKYMISATLIILAVFCFLLFLRVFAPDNNSIDRTYSAQVDYVRIYKTTVYTKENVENRYGTLAGLANVNTDKALFRYHAMPVPGFSSLRTEPDQWLEKYLEGIDGNSYVSVLPSIVPDQYTKNLFVLTLMTTAFLLLLLIPASIKEPENIESLQLTSKAGHKIYHHKLFAALTAILFSFAAMLICLFIICSRFNFQLFFGSNIHSIFAMPDNTFIPIYAPGMTFGQYVAFTVFISFCQVAGVTGTFCVLVSRRRKAISAVLALLAGIAASFILNVIVFYPFLIVPRFLSPEFKLYSTYYSYIRYLYENSIISGKVLRSTGAFQLIISFILLAVFAAVLFLKLKRISVKKPIDTEAFSI